MFSSNPSSQVRVDKHMHMEIAESDFLFNGGADSCHLSPCPTSFFLPHHPFLDMEVIMTSVPSQKGSSSGCSPEDGNHVLKVEGQEEGRNLGP